jgi:hypothetical protein
MISALPLLRTPLCERSAHTARFCPRNPGPAFLDGGWFHDEMAVFAVTFARQPSDCWGSWESRLYRLYLST